LAFILRAWKDTHYFKQESDKNLTWDLKRLLWLQFTTGWKGKTRRRKWCLEIKVLLAFIHSNSGFRLSMEKVEFEAVVEN
jgi:hypothetical protein